MPSDSKKKENFKAIAVNRVARHDYFILEIVEAGLELKGSEVKALREGGANLKEGYAHIENGFALLEGVHIAPYSHGNQQNHSSVRTRKLLLHKREIGKLSDRLQQERLTLVPLRIYFKDGWAKLELGLAKGKKYQDKREAIKKQEIKRDLSRIERLRTKKGVDR